MPQRMLAAVTAARLRFGCLTKPAAPMTTPREPSGAPPVARWNGMKAHRLRPFVITVALALGGSGLAAAAVQPAAAVTRSGAGDCIAHRPSEVAGEVWYTGGCSGHDEPELDPVSSLPGSAKDLTWTVVLPSDGSVP